jgi:hypothetical protein
MQQQIDLLNPFHILNLRYNIENGTNQSWTTTSQVWLLAMATYINSPQHQLHNGNASWQNDEQLLKIKLTPPLHRGTRSHGSGIVRPLSGIPSSVLVCCL